MNMELFYPLPLSALLLAERSIPVVLCWLIAVVFDKIERSVKDKDRSM